MQQREGRWSFLILSFTLLFGVTLAASGADGPPVIMNGDFMQGTDEGNLPLHWVEFGRVPDVAHYMLSEERSTVGSVSLKMIDLAADASTGLRSKQVEVTPGKRYVAQVDAFVEMGEAMVYMDFLNANGQRIEAPAVRTTTTSTWETVTLDAVAPHGAAHVTLILYSSKVNVGISFFDNVRLGYGS